MERSTNVPSYLGKAIQNHSLQKEQSFERVDGVAFERFARHVPHERVGSGVVRATDDNSIWEVHDGQVFRMKNNVEIEQALNALAASSCSTPSTDKKKKKEKKEAQVGGRTRFDSIIKEKVDAAKSLAKKISAEHPNLSESVVLELAHGLIADSVKSLDEFEDQLNQAVYEHLGEPLPGSEEAMQNAAEGLPQLDSAPLEPQLVEAKKKIKTQRELPKLEPTSSPFIAQYKDLGAFRDALRSGEVPVEELNPQDVAELIWHWRGLRSFYPVFETFDKLGAQDFAKQVIDILLAKIGDNQNLLVLLTADMPRGELQRYVASHVNIEGLDETLRNVLDEALYEEMEPSEQGTPPGQYPELSPPWRLGLWRGKKTKVQKKTEAQKKEGTRPFDLRKAQLDYPNITAFINDLRQPNFEISSLDAEEVATWLRERAGLDSFSRFFKTLLELGYRSFAISILWQFLMKGINVQQVHLLLEDLPSELRDFVRDKWSQIQRRAKKKVKKPLREK